MDPRFTSRKFILALVASVIAGFTVFARHYWGIEIDTSEVMAVLIPLLSFIGIEGVADIAERYKAADFHDEVTEEVIEEE